MEEFGGSFLSAQMVTISGSWTTAGTNAYSLVPQLLRLRHVQSNWCHRFFASKRTVSLLPWESRINALNEMFETISALPRELPGTLKQILDIDAIYTNILLMAPSLHSMPGMSSYGQALLFDYIVQYSQVAWLMCDYSQGFKHLTICDLVRARVVGLRLLQIVQYPEGSLLNNIQPRPPATDTGSLTPALQPRDASSLTLKAIDSLTQIDQVLDTLGTKFGQAQHETQLRGALASTLRSLDTIRQHISRVVPSTHFRTASTPVLPSNGYGPWSRNAGNDGYYHQLT